MKTQLILLSILLGSAFLVAAVPAAAAISTCTFTATESSYTYTVTASPCTQTGLTSGSVSYGATINLQASTTNAAIKSVDYAITNPTATTTSYYYLSTAPYSQTFTASAVGNWVVNTYFCLSSTSCTLSPFYDKISFQVNILVLNEVPLGVVSVFAISLVGLGLFRRTKRARVR